MFSFSFFFKKKEPVSLLKTYYALNKLSARSWECTGDMKFVHTDSAPYSTRGVWEFRVGLDYCLNTGTRAHMVAVLCNPKMSWQQTLPGHFYGWMCKLHRGSEATLWENPTKHWRSQQSWCNWKHLTMGDGWVSLNKCAWSHFYDMYSNIMFLMV